VRSIDTTVHNFRSSRGGQEKQFGGVLSITVCCMVRRDLEILSFCVIRSGFAWWKVCDESCECKPSFVRRHPHLAGLIENLETTCRCNLRTRFHVFPIVLIMIHLTTFANPLFWYATDSSSTLPILIHSPREDVQFHPSRVLSLPGYKVHLFRYIQSSLHHSASQGRYLLCSLSSSSTLHHHHHVFSTIITMRSVPGIVEKHLTDRQPAIIIQPKVMDGLFR
jgi:hypothetical protein